MQHKAMQRFVNLLDVLSRIASLAAEMPVDFVTIKCRNGREHLVWRDSITLHSWGIFAESQGGHEPVAVLYDDLKEILGTVADVDVDEFGYAFYCDFTPVIRYQRFRNTKMFNQMRRV